ncbi:Histidine--tRNA ligase, chloroplastic/mitochondrial, partial [Cucurbita argyrosperma subsp. argyrosperma]
MAAKPSSLLIFQPRLNLRLKPFIFSSSSLAFSIILRIPFPKASFFGNRKFHSSLSAVSSAQSTGDGGNGGGRSGALSPTLVTEELQKIDGHKRSVTHVRPDSGAEAELLSSIVAFFKRIGLTAADVGFKVSSRKVLQEVLKCYGIPENMFGKVCIIIDKIEKIPLDEMKKELKVVGVSEDAIEEMLQVLSVKSLTKLEEILGGGGEAMSDLKQLFSLAEKFGYSDWIQFDASIVRGLAYYTGIVFEGFDRGGKLRAICGGGRYDRLLSTFGGDDLPACGFGFGDAVIVELLKEKKLLPELNVEVENIVCALDPDLQGAASRVATILREKGQTVDLVLENKPLKWVFKRAARINAQRLILVGSSEWQRGMVGVKDLSSGEQREVKLEELN